MITTIVLIFCNIQEYQQLMLLRGAYDGGGGGGCTDTGVARGECLGGGRTLSGEATTT